MTGTFGVEVQDWGIDDGDAVQVRVELSTEVGRVEVSLTVPDGTKVSATPHPAPVTGLTMGLTKLDTQLLQNPEIQGVEYQEGKLAGYEVRGASRRWEPHCGESGCAHSWLVERQAIEPLRKAQVLTKEDPADVRRSAAALRASVPLHALINL